MLLRVIIKAGLGPQGPFFPSLAERSCWVIALDVALADAAR